VNAWGVVLLLLGPIFVIIAVLRNQKRLSRLRSETVELTVDAFGVRRVLADGREEGVDWLDVTEVEVLTAKSGPHGESGGVVIVAGDEEHGCLVPIDRLQTSGLAEALTHLPGFDSLKLMEAITTKPPARISCWVRSGVGSGPTPPPG
jgi:hypothetical protein